MKYRTDDDTEYRMVLKRCRTRLGFSLDEMARCLGIPAFRLDKIEQGIQPCSEDLADQAEALWEEEWDKQYYESLRLDEEYDSLGPDLEAPETEAPEYDDTF